jgi:N-acetylmuramoyl-L-alanine amidase CwlA
MYAIKEELITPNKYSRPQTSLKKVLGIVIHWTANENRGADARANIRFFENRKLGRTGYGSAHYFVDDKNIIRCIPEDEVAYHVGATSYKTSRFGSYPNATMIGIEMCVNADGDFEKVYEQTIELTRYLCKKYNLNPDNDVVRHFDVTGKNCPAMFTSNHWGKINNAYAVKYGLGNNADKAWSTFKQNVKSIKASTSSSYSYDTSKGIGTVRVTYAKDTINIRKGSSFDSPVAKVAVYDDVFYVYGEENGMYNVGGGLWITAGESYVSFTPHPKEPAKPSPKEEPIAMFKDIAEHWAKEDIEALEKKGIVKGGADGNFNPEEKATRAHLAVMINRALDYIESKYK